MTSTERAQVDLETLVGERQLSGVDFDKMEVKRYEWSKDDDDKETVEVMRFILDGVTYEAIEDPSDGYRSSMRGCYVTDVAIKNSFAPVPVLGSWRTEGSSYGKDAVLELRDRANGKVVLEVGTENVDDYYPGFAAHWLPSNLAINAEPLNNQRGSNK